MTGRGEGGCVCLIPCSESESMGRFHHGKARHDQAEVQCIIRSAVHNIPGCVSGKAAVQSMQCETKLKEKENRVRITCII